MTTRATRACAALLAAGLAWHAGAVAAQELDYACDEQRSSLRLGEAYPDPRGHSERISLQGLVQYSPEDERGEVRRTGSRSLERRCGELRVELRGGYYNPNPQGELGAAEDYPIAWIYHGPDLLLGPVAFGECEASSPRQSAFAQCPQQWATGVRVQRESRGRGYSLWVRRTYEDWSTVAVPAPSPL